MAGTSTFQAPSYSRNTSIIMWAPHYTESDNASILLYCIPCRGGIGLQPFEESCPPQGSAGLTQFPVSFAWRHYMTPDRTTLAGDWDNSYDADVDRVRRMVYFTGFSFLSLLFFFSFFFFGTSL